MNLAEQIKAGIRNQNPIDYEGLASTLKTIFSKNPNARIRVWPEKTATIVHGQGDKRDHYYISMPKEWVIDVEDYAKNEGFSITRDGVTFIVMLF